MKRTHKSNKKQQQPPVTPDHPLGIDTIVHEVLCRDTTAVTRECDLFKFLLVSRVWYAVAAQLIQQEMLRSEAPFYELSFAENHTLLAETLGEMAHHDWLPGPLIDFLAPRLLQPYRARECSKRVLHMHWTGPAYMENTMQGTMTLLDRFLMTQRGAYYAAQRIDFNHRATIFADIDDQLHRCARRVDDDVDNPFIVFTMWLDGATVPGLLPYIESLLTGDGLEFSLPPGTVFICVWMSHFAGYTQYPTVSPINTHAIICDRMLETGMRHELVMLLNRNMILFSDR